MVPVTTNEMNIDQPLGPIKNSSLHHPPSEGDGAAAAAAAAGAAAGGSWLNLWRAAWPGATNDGWYS